METSEREAYRDWLQEAGATSIWFYAGFIIVLLPAFHFVLAAVPDHPPDSLLIRIAAAAISAAVALTVWLYRPARRYSATLQILNVLPTMLAIDVLVVDSGNHYLYIASALLMIVGAQQAFYLEWPLALVMTVALAFQTLYSAYAGIFYTPANIATLAIFAAGYILAFIPAALRMRIERREILGRLEARNLARNDALTGLPNRVSLSLHLAETLNGASDELGCAVLFLDLDGFKDVNDSLGHGVGDVLLRSVAQRLESALDRGTILARWGGDEFVIVLPAVGDPGVVSAFAKKSPAFSPTVFRRRLRTQHRREHRDLALACRWHRRERAHSQRSIRRCIARRRVTRRASRSGRPKCTMRPTCGTKLRARYARRFSRSASSSTINRSSIRQARDSSAPKRSCAGPTSPECATRRRSSA